MLQLSATHRCSQLKHIMVNASFEWYPNFKDMFLTYFFILLGESCLLWQDQLVSNWIQQVCHILTIYVFVSLKHVKKESNHIEAFLHWESYWGQHTCCLHMICLILMNSMIQTWWILVSPKHSYASFVNPCNHSNSHKWHWWHLIIWGSLNYMYLFNTCNSMYWSLVH